MMREEIDNLFVDFDEMGFCPTTLCKDAEEYAIEWRNNMRKAISNHETGLLKEFVEWEGEEIKRNLVGVSKESEALVYEIIAWFDSDLEKFLNEKENELAKK